MRLSPQSWLAAIPDPRPQWTVYRLCFGSFQAHRTIVLWHCFGRAREFHWWQAEQALRYRERETESREFFPSLFYDDLTRETET